jgi:hypothetical protein
MIALSLLLGLWGCGASAHMLVSESSGEHIVTAKYKNLNIQVMSWAIRGTVDGNPLGTARAIKTFCVENRTKKTVRITAHGKWYLVGKYGRKYFGFPHRAQVPTRVRRFPRVADARNVAGEITILPTQTLQFFIEFKAGGDIETTELVLTDIFIGDEEIPELKLRYRAVLK